MPNLSCLHVGTCNDVFLTYWANVMRDLPLMAEENFWCALKARLGQDIKVGGSAEDIVLNNRVVRRTRQAMSHFSQVVELLSDVTHALLHRHDLRVTLSFFFFVFLHRG